MKHRQAADFLRVLYDKISYSDISTEQEDAAVKYAIIVLTKLEKEEHGKTT